jgi:peptide/nickel transport system substrate-binding protein
MNRFRRPWSVLGLVVLLISGCSRGGGTGGSQEAKAGQKIPAAAKGNDVAPADRSALADGGTLRWPLDQIPPNYNYHEVDGTLADNADVIQALLPSVFDFDAAAQPVLKKDYVDSAELTATSPKQVITYRINPKATWDDGTPITVADFEAQWKALRGTDDRYKVTSTQGYDKMETVTRGADDREVVVTMSAPYADWQGVFSPLYPASTNRDPAVFNDGWKDKPLVTAGPFRLEGVDKTAQTITLVRNEKWWGRPAKLDRIIFRIVEGDAQIDALANNEIDFMGLGSDVNKLQRARSIKGIALRRALAPNFNHMTVNAMSDLLKDVDVRRALAMSIDRDTIAKALLGPLGVTPDPLQNHIFMANQKGYQDNAAAVAHDPAKAGQLLDKAGWKLTGPTRVKAGRELALRLVLPTQSAVGKQIAELIQTMTAPVGIKVNLETVPGADLFEKYVTPGNFDLVIFAWLGTPFPISSAKSIYVKPKPKPDGSLEIQQNYARVGSDEIDRLFDEATATLDPDKAIEIGNRIDKLIWDEVHSLTLYQGTGTVAIKENMANFGAPGFASVIYEDIGFRKG